MVGVIPSVHRDNTIASSLVVSDYISKHIKKEHGLPKSIKPRGVDSCFGNFPQAYKKGDYWDGNPTLRRGMRKDYRFRKKYYYL
jgi:hypothetical protein